MQFVEQQFSTSKISSAARLIVAAAYLGFGASVASAATLTRSVDVPGTPADVWSMIGPFCAIGDWLPPVGTCTEDGGKPPTRTLVTKDGKATFIERQSARSDATHFYTYTFLSSPLPVSRYISTIRVTARADGQSTVMWRGSYTPDAGKAKDANQALADIYAVGLESIRTQAVQRFAAVAKSSAGQ
jgi:hypothetical protein